jgi:RNA 3'-terminal phosphate cyclase (ATP)
VRGCANSAGPGNCILATAEYAAHQQVFSGIGQVGVSGDRLARTVAKAVERHVANDVLADDYLADQLLLPMAMAGAGAFTTTAISAHSETNMAVIQEFLPVSFQLERRSRLDWRVEVTKSI